jgi:hypothetical protein
MNSIEQTQNDPPQTMRSLDSMEELLWLIQPLSLGQHTTGIAVAGATDAIQWQTAWNEMHRRYPMLSTSIAKTRGERPKYVFTGRPTPLDVRHLDGSADMSKEIEDELGRSVGDGSDGLMRLTLCLGSERSLLLLTAHHSAADAKTSLFILEDLMASMAGETLTGDRPWPAPSSMLGQAKMAPYVSTLKPEDHAADEASELASPELPHVQVRHLALTNTETTTLRSRARAEKTTVHAALLVAFSSALARDSHSSAENAIRCGSPIDIRPVGGAREAVGTPVLFHIGMVDGNPDAPFWERARSVRAEIEAAQTPERAREVLDQITGAVAQEQTPARFLQMFAGQQSQYRLLVSNLGEFKLRARYGALEVESVILGVAPGAPSVQTISAGTLHGSLGLALISREPVPRLLEKARAILLEA